MDMPGKGKTKTFDKGDNAAMSADERSETFPDTKKSVAFPSTKKVVPLSSEKILAELLRYLQHVETRMKPNGAAGGLDEQNVANGSGEGDELSLKKVLSHVMKHMTIAHRQMKVEGIQWDGKLHKSVQSTLDICQNSDTDPSNTNTKALPLIKQLVGSVHKVLHTVRPVDLDKLLSLLEASKGAGDTMQGKDVLLFIGSTGSGKTTTIHYLAGSSFVEKEIDGYFHLEPVEICNSTLRSFETSAMARSVTRTVQSVEIVRRNGNRVVLCDSPGFQDTDGVEIDIANGLGIVQAIHRAKRVKPVLVLSEKGMGDRFEGVSAVLSTLTRLLGGGNSSNGSICISPLVYSFTKFDPKYKNLLYKQFRSKQTRLTDAERADPLFEALINDIVKKTDPTALIVSPLDGGSHEKLLTALMDGDWYDDPKEVFVPFVSESSQDKLSLQLRITFDHLRAALDRKDAEYVCFKLKQLRNLGDCLPSTREFADREIELVTAFVATRKRSLSSSLEVCLGLRDDVAAFRRELDSTMAGLNALLPFQCVCDLWMPGVSLALDFCNESIEPLLLELQNSILSNQERGSDSIRIEREKCEVVAMSLRCMKDVVDIFGGVLKYVKPELIDIYNQCCKAAVSSVVIRLEDVHKRVRPAGPGVSYSIENLQMLDVDMKYASFLIKALEDHHGIRTDLVTCTGMLEEATKTFKVELERIIQQAMQSLSQKEGNMSLAELASVDCKFVAGVAKVLGFLVHHSSILSDLSVMTSDVASGKAEELERAIVHFVGNSVDAVQEILDKNKEISGIHDGIEDVELYMTKLDEVMTFFRNISLRLSQQCEEHFKRYIILDRSFEEYCKILSDMQFSLIDKAEQYLQAMETVNSWTVLPELANAWNEWGVLIRRENNKKKKKRGFFQKVKNVFLLRGNGPRSDSDLICNLKTLRSKIGMKVQRNLMFVSKNITLVIGNHLAMEHFFEMEDDLFFFLEFTALYSHSIEFCRWVLSPPNTENLSKLNEIYLTAMEKLSDQLTPLSVLSASLKSVPLDEVVRLLDCMKSTDGFLGRMKNHSSKLDRRTPNFKRLCTCILNIKMYESLRQDMISSIQSLRQDIRGISLLDERQANSANEHIRNKFYRGVALTLSKLDGTEIIKHHLLDDEIDIGEMRQTAFDHIRSEVQRIFDHLKEPMCFFPEVESDYQKLYIWRSNLTSIEKCFSGSNIAGMAARLRDDVDCEMKQKLNVYVSNRSIPRDAGDFIMYLLTLKKASIQLPFWLSELNSAIDNLLLSTAKNSANAGMFILGIELELKKVRGVNAPVAKQILSDHNSFEGAMNAVFNSATARQGIDYVIDGLHLSDESQRILRSMYRSFKLQYESIVEKGLLAYSNDTSASFLKNVASAARDVANDYSTDYRSQLISLTAHIFAYWSLRCMNPFVLNATTKDTNNKGFLSDAVEFLMKPHVAQVIAIWSLLNYQQKEYRMLENHFVEILTGEGKSIALGVTAIVLSLMGCKVVCVCYSEYLSKRDFNAFQSMFESFGVRHLIKYQTVKGACDDIYSQDGDTRALSCDVVWGRKYANKSGSRKDSRMQVLLIDEVDVFFKDDFYGKTYDAITSVRHEAISALLQYVWVNKDSLTNSSLLMSDQAQACIDIFPKDVHPIVKKHIENALSDAKSLDSHEYLVSQGKIGYKVQDGISLTTRYGYSTLFAAMKEHEKGRVSESNMAWYMELGLSCGHVSYAEIPNLFDVILGVTGTLKALCEEELDVLKTQYGIERMIHMPSVYGNNKLLFAGDSCRDMIFGDSQSNFFMELRNEINFRLKPEKEGGVARAVIVFFENSKVLIDFYECEHMQDIKATTRTITEEIDLFEKDGAFLLATISGAVTLMIREFGRGTDFKCFDSRMDDSGGVHVIQAFFSTELAEEIQIKGRTARQGAKGSYSMVIDVTSLKKSLATNETDIDAMRRQSTQYSFLSNKRAETYSAGCIRRNGNVAEARKKHFETIGYRDCVLLGKRTDAVAYLKKWNIFPNASFFYSLFLRVSKESYVKKKAERMEKFEIEEKARRQREKLNGQSPGNVNSESKEEEGDKNASNTEKDKKSDNVWTVEDETYYEMLGVSPEAGTKEIEKAFRKASMTCHPDKSDSPNASDRFKKLCEAKDVLLCPSKRQLYNKQIGIH